MKRTAILLSALALAGVFASAAEAQTTVRVAWCARTVSSAAAPFAIATKMGWFAKDGIKVELVPMPGSTDCVKAVATKDVQYGLPSIEPLAIIRPQGVKVKNYYTAYQANIYGIAVPDDSPIKTFADLKGKKIGVTSMASAGVIVARALASNNGFNPDKDILIVVAGEAAQTAALLRGKQVDALSQFDTQYALTENAGAKLRLLDTKDIANFPSNGFIALEERLANNRAEAVALAQGYAKGTVFAIANPGGRDPHPVGGVPADQGDGQDRGRRDARRREDAGSAREKLAARIGRRQEVGRQFDRELRRLCGLPGEERRAQGKDRDHRPHHQRPDRRHQQVRREGDRGDGEGVEGVEMSSRASADEVRRDAGMHKALF